MYSSIRPQATHKALNYAGNPCIREFKLLFGVFAFLKTISNDGRGKSGQRPAFSYCLTFIPPRWFSTLILQWELRFRYANDGFPVFGISLSPIRYNSHPLLVKAIKSCDLVELQKLIRDGSVRANDYLLLRRRPMLLLEVQIVLPFVDIQGILIFD